MLDEKVFTRLKNNYESDMKILEIARPFKKLGLFLFTLQLPFQWLKSIVIQIIRRFFPSQGNKLSAQFIKSFYTLFFKYQGISHYWAQEDPPKKPKRPYIIVTMRYDYMSSLYLYTILKTPTIIPFKNQFTSFRNNFPENTIAPHIDSMTYDDAPLENTTEEIRTLLNKGYPVVIHLNHGTGNMFETEALFLHKSILDILDWDVDIYFLAMDGYENRRFSSFINGTLISCLMQSKQTVFKTAFPDTQSERIRCITEFFGFTQYTLLPN